MSDLFLLLSLICFFGSLIFLAIFFARLIKRRPAKKFIKASGLILIVSILSFVLFGITVPPTVNKDSDATADETAQEKTELGTEDNSETEVSLSDKESFTSGLAKNEFVTEDAAIATYEMLTDQLGFGKILLKGSNAVGNAVFDVEADEYNLTVVVSDKVYRILCGDFTLYSDDSLKMTKQDLDDRVIGNKDSTYYVISKEIVSSYLKNPSSAKYCSVNECAMERNKDYVVVNGYVDAMNSFNSLIRNEFIVEFKVNDLSSFSYEVVYVNINGEYTGTFIELN